ncbi:hypothetical protein [Nocardioides stalactiti]|uniref:hypothetical protein n=1 Tax=Nocardioides stalactiti TaxID=2755356 RepID=UPI0016027FB1|nr:hypothetical protein [Nocardioides stalactiti]
MGMTRAVLSVVAGLACVSLSSCSATTGSTGGNPDCVSHYDDVASATTWAGLKNAMLDSRDWGRVGSIRIQAQGVDIGAGDEDAVRVVDLLNRNGRRLVQVDVWRADSGAWRAGVWNQCID